MKNVGVSEEEESQVTHHRAVDSILFSIGGKLFMVQQEMSIGEQLASLQLVSQRAGPSCKGWSVSK